MKNNFKKCARTAVAGALLAGSSLSIASAPPTLTITSLLYTNWQTGIVTYNGTPAVNVNAFIGGYNTTLTTATGSTSFVSWCVDIFQDINLNTAYTNYTSSGTLTTTISNNIERLANEAYPLITNATTSAAFQIALWEIVNESSSNSFNVNSGLFSVLDKGSNQTVGDGSPSALGLAQTWLNNLNASPTTGYTMTLYQSATNQDVLALTPIPEPEIYAMMAAGLGLLGFVGRRSKLKN